MPNGYQLNDDEISRELRRWTYDEATDQVPLDGKPYKVPDQDDDDDGTLQDGERLRIPLMAADHNSVRVFLRDADPVQREVMRQQMCDAAARSVAGRVHAVPTVDRQLFADAEAARGQWIRNMQSAWQRPPVTSDSRSSSSANVNASTSTKNTNTGMMNNADKTYTKYCRSLENAWRK